MWLVVESIKKKSLAMPGSKLRTAHRYMPLKSRSRVLTPRNIFFFQAEDGIRYGTVTGVQTCALPILSVRPRRRGRDYARIWNRELNESPLKTITRAQSEKLGAALAARDPRIIVEWAMRYG